MHNILTQLWHTLPYALLGCGLGSLSRFATSRAIRHLAYRAGYRDGYKVSDNYKAPSGYFAAVQLRLAHILRDDAYVRLREARALAANLPDYLLNHSGK